MINDGGFSSGISLAMSIFASAVVIWVIVFYLQFNPFVPLAEVSGTNMTDTITVSGKVFDANNNWYEIITTDNVKYLTEPSNLADQVEVNHTYSVNIQKRQIKINLRGTVWSNSTYITSLKEANAV